MAHAGPSSSKVNGFTDQIVEKMSGSQGGLNLHAIAGNQAQASKAELRELRDAIQRRQLVENMLELTGTFFPGLDAIKQANATPDTSASVRERMQEMQKKHLEEVRTLHQWHAQDYYDEMLDASRSKSDHNDPAVEAFYKTFRSCYDLATSFDDELDRHHYAYLTAMASLRLRRKGLEARDKLERRIRDKQFPASLDAFHEISTKDAKIRVARFLTADEMGRERLRTEFSWTWSQVQPLIFEYNNNDEFKVEIQHLLQDLEVRDPRKARQTRQ